MINLTEILVHKFYFLFFIFFAQVDLFFHVCVNYYKNFIKPTVSLIQNWSLIDISIYIYSIFLIIFFSTDKSFIQISNVQVYVLFTIIIAINKLLKMFGKTTKYKLNIIVLVNFILYSCLYILNYMNSLLELLFFLELIGVLYYFYFLNNYNLTKITNLYYKNSLLFFLWNSFLTTLFFNVLLWYSLKYAGTVSFTELNFVSKDVTFTLLLVVSTSWKLGLPLFHFFKIELYKYLTRETFFLFSILSIFVNSCILWFILSQYFIYFIFLFYNFFLLTVLVLIVLIISNLNISNFLYFLAYSGLITLSTTLVLTLL